VTISLDATPTPNITTQFNLTGVVERITFNAEDTGYTVARLQAPRAHDLITIVGSFANIQAGQTLQLTGIWREHPQYGQQFQVTTYTETKPATLTGMEKYLGSGLIKGVGPVTAKRIVAYFGLETLEVIETASDRLIEVPGIGKHRVRIIQAAWHEQKAIKEVMVFLQSHGVSTTYAVKIFKQYGEKSIQIVTDNPYQLADDIYGIGFLTADQIARNLGLAPDSPFRYRAGIFHVLSTAAEDGHCYLPQPELIAGAIDKLTTTEYPATPESILDILAQMTHQQDLIVEYDEGRRQKAEGRRIDDREMPNPQSSKTAKPMVGESLEPICEKDNVAARSSSQPSAFCLLPSAFYFQPSFYYTEQSLATLAIKLSGQPQPVDLPRVRDWIDRFTQSKGITLSEQQQQAVEMSATSRILILTGGPGCGKTFCTRTIVALWKAMGRKIALAAPTGRAAQRLAEMAGIEAKTIHRLLEFDPARRGFKRGLEDPLPQDAIVIDEASMLDLFLANSLFKAIRPDACLLLVGDIDQLPSVGAGNVLADLINSSQIPVIRLTQVFRQSLESGIIRAAHQINKGQYPQLETITNTPQSDCLWHGGGTEPEHGVQTITELVSDFIPSLGFDPITDVQVLCPMTRGIVGTRHLNQVLQQILNPPHPDKPELNRGEAVLRVGDKVIQLKNDYQKEVFNGDLGRVIGIDTVEKEVTIGFDERAITYDYSDLNEVGLAWAISIHKSQGSEYPVVILPLYMQHYLLLSRNLAYTGLTRAKQLAIVVGSQKAIGLAVRNDRVGKRYTRLPERLRDR
jgi:exodeoxyribonuclease V alpha subunit